MVKSVIKITKEQYDRAMANKGHIVSADMEDVFGISILCGYGLYGHEVSKDGDNYIVTYWHGSSCD